jgi:hypothetical protein
MPNRSSIDAFAGDCWLGGMVVGMDIKLADAVAAVRDELMTAAAQGVGQGVQFAVGPIEVEFAVELRADAKAQSGFKAWVLSGDVEGGVSRGRTHRVSMTLTPRRADGGELLVSGDRERPEGPGDVSRRIGR